MTDIDTEMLGTSGQFSTVSIAMETENHIPQRISIGNIIHMMQNVGVFSITIYLQQC